MKTSCEGCNDKRYRLATRGDGTRAIERCDTCSENLTDNDALALAGKEGQAWLKGEADEVVFAHLLFLAAWGIFFGVIALSL